MTNQLFGTKSQSLNKVLISTLIVGFWSLLFAPKLVIAANAREKNLTALKAYYELQEEIRIDQEEKYLLIKTWKTEKEFNQLNQTELRNSIKLLQKNNGEKSKEIAFLEIKKKKKQEEIQKTWGFFKDFKKDKREIDLKEIESEIESKKLALSQSLQQIDEKNKKLAELENQSQEIENELKLLDTQTPFVPKALLDNWRKHQLVKQNLKRDQAATKYKSEVLKDFEGQNWVKGSQSLNEKARKRLEEINQIDQMQKAAPPMLKQPSSHHEDEGKVDRDGDSMLSQEEKDATQPHEGDFTALDQKEKQDKNLDQKIKLIFDNKNAIRLNLTYQKESNDRIKLLKTNAAKQSIEIKKLSDSKDKKLQQKESHWGPFKDYRKRESEIEAKKIKNEITLRERELQKTRRELEKEKNKLEQLKGEKENLDKALNELGYKRSWMPKFIDDPILKYHLVREQGKLKRADEKGKSSPTEKREANQQLGKPQDLQKSVTKPQVNLTATSTKTPSPLSPVAEEPKSNIKNELQNGDEASSGKTLNEHPESRVTASLITSEQKDLGLGREQGVLKVGDEKEKSPSPEKGKADQQLHKPEDLENSVRGPQEKLTATSNKISMHLSPVAEEEKSDIEDELQSGNEDSSGKTLNGNSQPQVTKGALNSGQKNLSLESKIKNEDGKSRQGLLSELKKGKTLKPKDQRDQKPLTTNATGVQDQGNGDQSLKPQKAALMLSVMDQFRNDITQQQSRAVLNSVKAVATNFKNLKEKLNSEQENLNLSQEKLREARIATERNEDSSKKKTLEDRVRVLENEVKFLESRTKDLEVQVKGVEEELNTRMQTLSPADVKKVTQLLEGSNHQKKAVILTQQDKINQQSKEQKSKLKKQHPAKVKAKEMLKEIRELSERSSDLRADREKLQNLMASGEEDKINQMKEKVDNNEKRVKFYTKKVAEFKRELKELYEPSSQVEKQEIEEELNALLKGYPEALADVLSFLGTSHSSTANSISPDGSTHNPMSNATSDPLESVLGEHKSANQLSAPACESEDKVLGKVGRQLENISSLPVDDSRRTSATKALDEAQKQKTLETLHLQNNWIE